MTSDTFDLPPSLHDWMASGADPRDTLGDQWKFLIEQLTETEFLTDSDRERLSTEARRTAEDLASGFDGGYPEMSPERRYRVAVRQWWSADLIDNTETRHSVLALIDPIDAAEVDVVSDQLARPAPLVSLRSTGELCDSCAKMVTQGESMVTFERRSPLRNRPRSLPDFIAAAPLEMREHLTTDMHRAWAEEDHRLTEWRWCSSCVAVTEGACLTGQAPLVNSAVSSEELCESCAGEINVGETVLTFDMTPELKTFVDPDEEISKPFGWRWCTLCVASTL